MNNIDYLNEQLNTLSPIEKIGNLYIKREDLFRPLNNNINGTKLRECIAIILANLQMAKNGVITGCSINSPQAPIISQVCNFLNIESEIYYGGIKEVESKKYYSYLTNSKINMTCKSGRNSVLTCQMKKDKGNRLLIGYGMDMYCYPKLFKYIAHQVDNFPSEVENIYLVCGSGVTTTGLIIGLVERNLYKKITIVNTAPSRMVKIRKYLNEYYANKDKETELANIILNNICEIKLHDMVGFNYDKEECYSFNGIDLHCRYEAKAFKYLMENNLFENNSLFYIIGGNL